METIFSQEQLSTIKSKIWWVACNETPFLIKSAVHQNCILLCITDLRTLWVTRVDDKKLLRDKQIYAKTLQVSNINELVGLFQGILSNPEQKALYKFTKKVSGDLVFQIQKQIQVYPLTWKFDLIQVQCDIMHMVCEDIINPLSRTLNAQQKRIHIFTKKMEMMQKQMLKRMTQTQKIHYKSPLIEDEEDLKFLINLPKQQEYISDIGMDNKSKYLFERSMKNYKASKIHPNDRNNRRQKNIKIQKIFINSQLNANQIINQLQMKKDQDQVKKKKKFIDFI